VLALPLAADDPNRTIALHNLVGVERGTAGGAIQRAGAVLDQATRGATGADDPALVRYLHTAGVAYLDAGIRETAEGYLRRAESLARAHATDDLPGVLQSLSTLAAERGQNDEALALAEESLAGRRQRLAPEHLDVLSATLQVAAHGLDQRRGTGTSQETHDLSCLSGGA
jgi:hypothetical protein